MVVDVGEEDRAARVGLAHDDDLGLVLEVHSREGTQRQVDALPLLQGRDRHRKLDGRVVPAAVGAIRAEIDEARALEQEAGTFAETARMISACAMRASI